MRGLSRGQHSSSPAWWARWPAIAAVVALLAGGTAAAVAVATSGPSPAQVAAAKQRAAARRASAELAAAQAEVARLVSAVTIVPAPGSSKVSPSTPVTVTSPSGNLSSVVVSAGGSPLAGVLTPDHTKWTSSSGLQPGATYTVTATVSGPQGVTAQRTASFSTVTPVSTVSATLFPYGGATVGVGQPVVVKFNHAVTTAAAQQAVLSHFTVTESNPVPGGWHWFSPYELHFRPQSYWPTGEQVAVVSNLNGWDAGDGRWGTGSVTANFVIGDSHVSVANLATERMTVYVNGAAIATYPISGGRPQYPTMNGIHVVLDKEHVVHMVSSTVGIPVNSPNGYDEYVYNDVHISDSGEYVHDAPWSVGSQGVTNVSHGCINLGPNDSLAFYNFSRVGDVVQVVGGPRAPATGDHGVMDWSTDWSQWTPGTVLPATPPPTSTTTSLPASPSSPTTTTPPSTTSTTVPGRSQ